MNRSLASRLPRALRPLSRRLPALVVSIVVVMMAAVLYLGFNRVHQLAVETAAAHLQASSQQLVSAFQAGGVRLRREAGRMAALPELGRAASGLASASDIEAARRVIAAELQRSPQTAAIALWSRQGELVVFVGDRGVAESAPPRFTDLREAPSDTAGVIAPLIVRGDSIFIAVAGRVPGITGNGGYVISSRRMANNPQALALLRGLVGPEARILLGNDDGGVWTDFSRRLDGIGVAADSGIGQHVNADGVGWLHSLERIPGTPWRIMVEVPRRWATAAAGRVVLEMGAVAAALIILGAFVIWLAIGRSLRPLHRVTDAVGAMARGDATAPVRVDSDDELGQLAVAFNSMSEQVQASARELATRADALEGFNRELAESEQRYRVLVDHMPDGILVHRDRTISFANRASASIFGAAHPDDLLGRSIFDLVEARDHAAVAERVDSVQKTGKPAPPRELKVRRGSGRPVLIEATSMHLSIEGLSAVQTILHDVTERRMLEEQLRQSQKMDAVGRLAGGVAHDFNNILTVIDAHAEFAKRPGTPEDERLADIEEIRKASGSAARLTRQLLAFSRKQAIAPTRIDLNGTVQGLLSMLNRLIGETVVVAADLRPGLWAIRADASQMEQVLMNLSVNARDAMPKGGTLSFRTSNSSIAADYRTPGGELVPEGEYVLLTVEDSGVGMTEEIQSKVFEPFFTTKQPGQGTGLGLSTVYGIVKQAGGFIWIYSETNRGSAFKILLPRYSGDDDELPALARTSEHRIEGLRARILLVEDQVAVRSVISRSLRGAGFTVHEASDAEQAEGILGGPDGGNIDLIVTDMMMPGKTGAEFTAGPLIADREIPVVIMSGYSEEFTNREWRIPPNASFLDKPVSPSELIRLIAKLLG